jgi:LPXTG-motif cell wall-anchored protein
VQIGAGTADADGTFDAVLTIPAGTPPGAHSATVYGIAPDGSEVVDVSYFTLDENGMVLDASDVAPTRPYVPPTLPETGGSVSIAWLSLALLAGGSVLAAAARRRRHSAA